MSQLALSDVTVLDLSDNVAGAYCGRLLAGFGADVIKVEPPRLGDSARALLAHFRKTFPIQRRAVFFCI